MPELPDIAIYIEALDRKVLGQTLEGIRIASPFLVRSIDPPVDRFAGRLVTGLNRLGKRIVIEFEGDHFLVLHLMIAGRLRWKKKGAGLSARFGLAAFDFPDGSLLLTEAGSKRRASLHLLRGESALAAHDPGGLEVLNADEAAFRERMLRENRTLKRALTDPRLLSGIGNAYSDEILHAARLSPAKLTARLSEDETTRLHEAARATLTQWIETLRKEFSDRFPGPGDITAFRDGFAVHGRFDQPCPVCKTPVQRIRLANHEHNYCPKCQTGGKVLKDRSLSRLLKDDWPKSIDDL